MDDVYDLYQRGMALLEDGHFHQATIPLAKARDLEPDKTSIREALGRAYFRSGGFEEARVELFFTGARHLGLTSFEDGIVISRPARRVSATLLVRTSVARAHGD